MKPLIEKQVEDYLQFCQYDRNLTRQTLNSKRLILQQFMHQIALKDMQDFTTEAFRNWRRDLILSGTVSASTVNTRVSHVTSLCKWLRDEGYTIQLQLSRIYRLKEEPPRRNYFTRAQIELALEHAAPLAWLLISIKFDSGLRISELQNLRLENIEGRQIRIVGKGRKAGQLFMSQETRDRLDRWISSKQVTDYLWPSSVGDGGKPYSLHQLRARMCKPFEEAGLTGFYPHSLRHSFGTDLQLNGAPMEVTQKLMRHSNIATTERYLHGLDNQKLANLYDKFKKPSQPEYHELAHSRAYE